MITASPFLLLLIAATQMRVDVCRSKGSSMEDISGFALALRCPDREYSVIQSFTLLIGIAAKEPYHRLVQDLILPQLEYLLDLALDAPWFNLSFWDDVDHCWSRRPFSDVVPIRDVLDKAEVK